MTMIAKADAFRKRVRSIDERGQTNLTHIVAEIPRAIDRLPVDLQFLIDLLRTVSSCIFRPALCQTSYVF
jgi:hypothetical protein